MNIKIDAKFDEIINLLKRESEIRVQAIHPTKLGAKACRKFNNPMFWHVIAKCEDIRLFPQYEDPDDKGIIVGGKNLIFTDTFAFGERIDSGRQ